MISVKLQLFIPLILLLCGPQHTQSGNVLVFPGEYSHWYNMRVIVEELVDRNHSVTVLVNSASPTVKYTQTERFNFKVFKVPLEKQEVHAVWQEFTNLGMSQSQNTSKLQMVFKTVDVFTKLMAQSVSMCYAMMRNEELLDILRRSNFEALLCDPMSSCGDLMADTLGVPFLLSVRFSFGYNLERICGQMPAPPSYVPAAPVQLTDQMNFMERLQNLLLFTLHSTVFYMQTRWYADVIYSEIKGKPTTFCEVLGKADIWLIRTYWDFEYPRPFLPNFKFVGGLQCKPAKPLPDDMEEFVQSSGDDGVVVFSLGSMFGNLTKERGNTIASALGQIRQKVVWGYGGEKPETLAPNTRVYDWIPQNDLLGHPKTKAFITHGGTNGLYEAIYHAVLIVGIPLFADQPHNLFIMKSKGAAVILDLSKMESKDLTEALNAVINEPSYKESIMRLSSIHHDQPMKPLDQAVFWIEFVMRNKGAKHLRVQAHNLTWYQYHCLDVAAFLLAIVALVTYIWIKTCSFLFRKCCRRTQLKRKAE